MVKLFIYTMDNYFNTKTGLCLDHSRKECPCCNDRVEYAKWVKDGNSPFEWNSETFDFTTGDKIGLPYETYAVKVSSSKPIGENLSSVLTQINDQKEQSEWEKKISNWENN